jgi:hypothetical protein
MNNSDSNPNAVLAIFAGFSLFAIAAIVVVWLVLALTVPQSG